MDQLLHWLTLHQVDESLGIVCQIPISHQTFKPGCGPIVFDRRIFRGGERFSVFSSTENRLLLLIEQRLHRRRHLRLGLTADNTGHPKGVKRGQKGVKKGVKKGSNIKLSF